MNHLLSTVQRYAESNDFYSVLDFLREKEKAGEIVLYAGTYSLAMALERFGYYECASFYIYTKEEKNGYCVFLNRMGCGITQDPKLLRFSHRYLYSKKRLLSTIISP